MAGVPAGEFGAAVSRIVAGVWGVPMEMSAKPPSDAVSVKPVWLTLSIDAVRSACVAAATRIGECVVKSQPIWVANVPPNAYCSWPVPVISKGSVAPPTVMSSAEKSNDRFTPAKSISMSKRI